MELKYSKDGLVNFNPETHTYLKGEKRLLGVTSFINRFKNKFDAEAQSAIYALKYGLDQKEVLIKWKYEGVISRESGTAVHKVIENYVITGRLQITGVYRKELTAIRFINDFFDTKRLLPVSCEEIVYNDKLASQIDLIAKDRNNNYYIVDWKSCKEIKKNGWGRCLLHPFSKYPDSNYYHYSLQTSLYKRLCKDYSIKAMYIVHFGDDGYSFHLAENIDIPEELIC